MTEATIAFIGCGNMGNCLITGLIRKGHPPEKMWASDPSIEKIEKLRNAFGIQITQDNLQAAQSASLIILAIKPQLMAQIVASLSEIVQKNKPLVCSIAAGILEGSIQSWLKGGVAIIRAMPNTPALIGCGITALYANAFVGSKDQQLAGSILAALGEIVWLKNENLMDTVTALSGCGPAYFFLIMECLQQTAVEMGLEESIAKQLTMQTALGAARMAIYSQEPLSLLRQQVTSAGGVTEKAIAVLEQNNIRDLFRKTLQAAKIRSEELARQMGK